MEINLTKFSCNIYKIDTFYQAYYVIIRLENNQKKVQKVISQPLKLKSIQISSE